MIPNWLLKRAALSPGARAFSFEELTWTYGELLEAAAEQAGKLRAAGLGSDSRIALLGGTSADMALVIHGCLLAGVEMVMLNARLTAEEIAYQLDDAEADLVLYEDPFAAQIAAAPCRTLAYSAFRALAPLPIQPVREWDEDRTLTIMYTSGTTGFPKGVRQTAGNHTASAVSAALNSGLHEGDAWLHTMPLFHISGFSILARAVLYGSEVRLFRKFDAAAAAEEICSGRVTGMSVVAVTLERLLSELEDSRRTVPASFRMVLAGGGPFPVRHLERAHKLGLPVMQSYGMTETSSQTATLAAGDALRKIGSSGKPLFFAEIRIEGAEGPYERGEILIRGPHVTKGYIGRHAGKPAQQDGWLHSGDIGYFDDEGFLFVSDRRSDLIISGGENIYPAEIESVLTDHPAVKEAGVCAMPDEEWGAVPAAFVTLSAPVAAEELEAFCKTRLAAYKIPKLFRVIGEMPRNASNKLMRSKLRELLADQ